jgi:RNA polymerase sigma-70 factor (ECF subfamily)
MANRHPAAACYLRPRGQATYRLVTLNVLRIVDGEIAEIATFSLPLIAGFDLPSSV